MKRTIGITLSALALVLTVGAALAEETPATPQTPASSTDQQAPAKPAAKHHAMAKSAKHAMVDLNSAAKEDLMKLPGVTDATADKIVAARPFKSRSELLSKNILTKAEYRKVKGWVVAKQ